MSLPKFPIKIKLLKPSKSLSQTSRSFYDNSGSTTAESFLRKTPPLIEANNGKTPTIFQQTINLYQKFPQKHTDLIDSNSEKIEVDDFFFLDPKNESEEQKVESISKIDSVDLVKKLSIWDKNNLENSHSGGTQSRNSNYKPTIRRVKKSQLVNVLDNDHSYNPIKISRQIERRRKAQHFNFNVFLSKSSSMPEIKATNKDKESATHYYKLYMKEQGKEESKERNKMIEVYYNIIKLKIKKKEIEEVNNTIYKIMEEAKTEYYLCRDILKERTNSVQKYYDAFLDGAHVQQAEGKEEETLRSTNSLNGNVAVKKSDKGLVTVKDGEEKPKTKFYQGGKKKLPDNSEEEETSEVKNEKEKKKIKKKSMMEIYEEKIRKYREYQSIVEDINKELRGYEEKFLTIKKELTSMIDEGKKKTSEISNKLSTMKKIFEILVKEQREYYIALLKNGSDTRQEGLIWIIKKLMELNAKIEPSFFPSFLSRTQVEYLIQLSEVSYEMFQINLLLKGLKNRQKSLFDKEADEENSFLMKGSFNFTTQSKKVTVSTFLDCFKKDKTFSKSLLQKFEEIYTRNESYMRHLVESKIETNFIKKIIDKIKSHLRAWIYKKGVTLSGKNYYASALLRDEKNKEYFEDIFILQGRIKELQTEKDALIRKQAKEFKNNFYNIDLKTNSKISDYYDSVYSALFGTKLVL